MDYTSLLHKDHQIGCRVLLNPVMQNPNGYGLRCGDKVNNLNWNPNEGVVQLCPICILRKQNATLVDMLNRRRND